MEEAMKAKKPTLLDIKYKEHCMQTAAALNFIRRLDLPSEKELEEMKSKEWLDFNQKMDLKFGEKRKKTLIFDLDETLIHVAKKTKGCEFKIPVKMKEGNTVKVRKKNSSLKKFNFFSLKFFEKKFSLFFGKFF